MLKSILCAFVLAACTSKPTYPTNNVDETRWLQEYRDGKLSWSEYQEKLKSEKRP